MPLLLAVRGWALLLGCAIPWAHAASVQSNTQDTRALRAHGHLDFQITIPRTLAFQVGGPGLHLPSLSHPSLPPTSPAPARVVVTRLTSSPGASAVTGRNGSQPTWSHAPSRRRTLEIEQRWPDPAVPPAEGRWTYTASSP